MSKMQLRSLWFAGLAFAAVPAFGQINGPLNPQRDFVATDKDAYLMLLPELICGPSIQETTWSTDGERLLIMRRYTEVTPELASQMILPGADRQIALPPTDQQVISWNSVTRKTSYLYRLSDKDGVIREAQWMSGSSSVIVVATYYQGDDPAQYRSNLFLVNSGGAIKNVTPLDTRAEFRVNASPYRPTAALVEYPPFVPPVKGDPPAPQNPATVRFFSFDGVLSQPFKFPTSHSFLFWSSDGRAYSETFQHDVRTKTSKKIWAYANMSTHKFESCDGPSDSGADAPVLSQEIGVVALSAKASFKKVGINAPTVLAMASDESKDNSPGVVTTDGINPNLSPKLNAVSYVSQGSLMVRSMVKVPLDAYKRALDAALRTQLLSRAKQVGLALLMYSGDYDDNFPSNQGNWAGLLGPYMKDSNLTDGFNYTFGGGSATGIQDPADTQLGYIDGPGGRAVVFSDGHAKWIPNH